MCVSWWANCQEALVTFAAGVYMAVALSVYRLVLTTPVRTDFACERLRRWTGQRWWLANSYRIPGDPSI